MTDPTKNTLIIIAAGLAALLIMLVAVALYQGVITIPTEVQTAFWGALIAVITGGSVYLNARSNAALRGDTNRIAEAVQERATQTEAKVADVLHEVKNGLPARVETLVTASAAGVAEALRIAHQEQSIALLTAKVDALLAAQAAPVPLAAADVTLQAIETNTADTAANTERVLS